MKRTVALALTVVAAAACGLGYIGYGALSAERLRIEQTIRHAHEEGLRPLLFLVEQQLFVDAEQRFAEAIGPVESTPDPRRMLAAKAALALVDEPYAVDQGRIHVCRTTKGGHPILERSADFLANREQIPYVQRRQQKQQLVEQQIEQQGQRMAPQTADDAQRALPQTAFGQNGLNNELGNVQTYWNSAELAASPANWEVALSRLSDIVATRESVFIPRFLDDQLELLYWRRSGPPPAQPAQSDDQQQLAAPADEPPSGYGFVVDMATLRQRLAELSAAHATGPDLVAAMLDDKGRLIGASRPGFRAGGHRPAFVSLDLHPNLPHWKLALYWSRPEALEELVRSRHWTLALLLGGSAIALLGGLAVLGIEVRRESVLARKQADFVSNVSHELKTPLTSIRMYGELLERRFGAEHPKVAEYSGVIVAESDRLARLVGRVLDFSRMQVGSPGTELEFAL